MSYLGTKGLREIDIDKRLELCGGGPRPWKDSDFWRRDLLYCCRLRLVIPDFGQRGNTRLVLVCLLVDLCFVGSVAILAARKLRPQASVSAYC